MQASRRILVRFTILQWIRTLYMLVLSSSLATSHCVSGCSSYMYEFKTGACTVHACGYTYTKLASVCANIWTATLQILHKESVCVCVCGWVGGRRFIMPKNSRLHTPLEQSLWELQNASISFEIGQFKHKVRAPKVSSYHSVLVSYEPVIMCHNVS